MVTAPARAEGRGAATAPTCSADAPPSAQQSARREGREKGREGRAGELIIAPSRPLATGERERKENGEP
eukprot:scaffold47677_cov26-Tisochrysis_lutea.AAC.1